MSLRPDMTDPGMHELVRAAGKVLVIKLGAFGDVVLAEGALRDIRRHHPKATITALTTPGYAAIFERCPHVDVVEIDPRKPRWQLPYLLELRRRLRASDYDLVYDLQNSNRTAMYFRWMRQPILWSGTAPGCSLPYRPGVVLRTIPVLDRLAGQLADAGVATPHCRRPDPGWMADDVSGILEAHGISDGFVFLIPGASARHPQKRWPHYARLAELLVGQGYEVVTAPGPDEMDLCRSLPAIMLTEHGDCLSLFQIAGLVTHAGFVVGNDTGPTHLAAHCGARGLALYGPHAAARITCMDRRLEVMEVPDLSRLDAERVFETVVAGLRTQGAGA